MTSRRNILKLAPLLGLSLAAKAADKNKEKKNIFSGKVVAITGATSGIGEATARAFAEEGAIVYFCGRRSHLGKKIQNEINQGGGKSFYIQTDVRKENEVNAFFDQVIKAQDKIDVVFLNAGIAPAPALLHDTSVADMNNIMSTNLYGVIYGAKKALPTMLKQKNGIIFINSSFGAKRVIHGESIYSASKIALHSIVRHIAHEYRNNNIWCIGINPIGVRSHMLENRARYLKMPIEKIGNPFTGKLVESSEVAALIVSIAMNENAKLLNGSNLDLSEGGSNEYLIINRKKDV